ncbi:hypothetical protein LDO32_18280 [Luteimonas sp. Y-2-2-4F]|nr:hypothetical protein [Luteimonas sp. Y-2-2-4F]MCD9033662.1 hypothetical protein [Luteimonas sp. Y-2-2-4F]
MDTPVRLLSPLLAVLLLGCSSAGPAREPAAPAAAAPSPAAAGPPHRHDPRLRASSPRPPAVPSPVAVPLDEATLARLPRSAVSARVHETTLHCEGVPLIALLRASGAVPEGPLRGPHLSRYVLVGARDGYRVVFSLAELDPGTGDRAAWIVDRCGGAPLDAETGPLRLLVPGDVRAARSVRQLEAITVVVAP